MTINFRAAPYFIFNCTHEGLLYEVIKDPGCFLSELQPRASFGKILAAEDNIKFVQFINSIFKEGISVIPGLSVFSKSTRHHFSFIGRLEDNMAQIAALQLSEELLVFHTGMIDFFEKQQKELLAIRNKHSMLLKEGGPDLQQILTDYMQLNNEMSSMQRELAIKHRELEKAYNKIEKLSFTDPLTGAGNRRMFIERISDEMERSARYGQPLSLIMLDIDHFKKVNDTYGHSAGDKVLQDFSSCCESTLRNSDCFFRLGGEEFAALLINADTESAAITAERLRRDVEKLSIRTEGKEIRITVSSGIAEFIPVEDVDIFMKRADSALYQAKNNGRNRYFCHARETSYPAA